MAEIVDKTRNKSNRKSGVKLHEKQPLVYFLSVFCVLFLVIMLLFSVLKTPFASIYTSFGKAILAPLVNKPANNRNLKFSLSDDKKEVVLAQVIYKDRKNPDDTLVSKNITINIFNEAYIPLVFLICLIAATPLDYRRRLWAMLWGFLIVQSMLLFKFSAMIFDNYTYPDYAIIPLPFPIEQLVWLVNAFQAMTGASFNVVLPVLLWIIVTFKRNDLDIKKWLKTGKVKFGINKF
jgi:hypothetical protein